MECYSLRKIDHDNIFYHCYRNLKQFRETGKLTDVIVKVGDTSYQAHSVILAIASNFFRITFTNNFQEDKTKMVFLENIDNKEFEIILDYVYGEKLRITTENAVFLLVACDYLQIKSGGAICYRFILDNLKNINHMFQLYIFLFLSSDCILYKKVLSYIAENWYDVCTVENICEVSFEILKDLLSLKYLIVNKDEGIFEICENWMMFDLENRRHCFVELAQILARKCVFEEKYNLFEALKKYDTVIPYVERLHIPEDTRALQGPVEVTEDKPWFSAFKGKQLQFYSYDGNSWTPVRGFGLTRQFDDTLVYASAAICYENVFVVAEFEDFIIPKQFYVTNMRTKRCTYLKLPISPNDTDRVNDKMITYQKNLFNLNDTLVFCEDWKISVYSQEVNRWLGLSNCGISKFRPNYACDGNLLFAIGAKSPRNNYQTRMVHKFDHRLKMWIKCAPLHRNIGRLASCFFNDNLYVANYEMAFMYDLRANRWSQLDSLSTFNGYGLSMAEYQRQIYYLQVHNHFSCFDTNTQSWSQKPRPLLNWNLNNVNI